MRAAPSPSFANRLRGKLRDLSPTGEGNEGLPAAYGLPLPPCAPTEVPVLKLASSDASMT
ncbi:hypothetical protein HNO88_000191 [Novosphingobium chloroacetimidivorans]|uniref:Uncharacterized protein n=1 Tax=Novosphingobium chloroacetimidivorans TaxID=1428314 RepID=A0A7W7NV40_9SPHN|nr:hypothetical protein [Novosphingobium chloroacetimidivorans]